MESLDGIPRFHEYLVVTETLTGRQPSELMSSHSYGTSTVVVASLHQHSSVFYPS